MCQYVLDTDHVTLFQYEHPKITQQARIIGSSNIFVTVVTLEEQFRGRLAGIGRAAIKSEQLSVAYTNLNRTLLYLCRVNLLGFDDKAYSCYQNLVRQRIRIGTQDLKIAAIALSNQLVLVTRNQQDFNKVPGLILEDWSV